MDENTKKERKRERGSFRAIKKAGTLLDPNGGLIIWRELYLKIWWLIPELSFWNHHNRESISETTIISFPIVRCGPSIVCVGGNLWPPTR